MYCLLVIVAFSLVLWYTCDTTNNNLDNSCAKSKACDNNNTLSLSDCAVRSIVDETINPPYALSIRYSFRRFNMEGNRNAYIYIVFSNTPSKMGRFIRTVTHGAYNHVSIALDGNLSEMYSFARLKRDTPFCGGFVHEGAERFKLGNRTADISVCGVKVGEDGVKKVRGRIKYMEEQSDVYIYNMFSAMLVPLHKKAYVQDSFTCVEFVSAILKMAGVRLLGECYSATELYTQLHDCELYKGEYPDSAPVVDESYSDRVSIHRRIINSAKQLGRLIHRIFVH